MVGEKGGRQRGAVVMVFVRGTEKLREIKCERDGAGERASEERVGEIAGEDLRGRGVAGSVVAKVRGS